MPDRTGWSEIVSMWPHDPRIKAFSVIPSSAWDPCDGWGMPKTPVNSLQTPGDAAAAPLLRLGALKGADGSLGTAALLLEVAGVTTVEVVSVPALVDLARNGSIAAVVIDPELGDGWPIDTAEQIATALRDNAPVIVVCGNSHDAEILEQRIGRSGACVLQHAGLTAQQLVDIVKGAVAAHSTRPPPRQPV